jgi:hypothetical protein
VPVTGLEVTWRHVTGLGITVTASFAIAGSLVAQVRRIVDRPRLVRLAGGAGLRRLSFAVAELRVVRART